MGLINDRGKHLRQRLHTAFSSAVGLGMESSSEELTNP
jgi:hypothetical protein